LYFGAMKAGAVAVPLPPGPRSDRLTRATIDCEPSAAIVDAVTAQEIDAKHPLASIGPLFVIGATSGSGLIGRERTLTDFREVLATARASPPAVRAIDIDLAAIIYTSGSTAQPRGVMLSHRNVVSNTQSIVAYLGLTAQDRVLCVLPLYYAYGLSLLHTHVVVGGSIVIENRFAFPNLALQAMQTHRVTGFAGVPSSFALLLHRSTLEEFQLPYLRYVTQAGGSMAPARITEWLKRGPRAAFYVMYGATEASARLTYLPPSELTRKAGSIGRPVPNVEVLVVRDDNTLAAPANVSRGYWNNIEETAKKFGLLGYRTGDLGYVDEEGFLFLVGRRDDMIKVGAHRVGAREIEDVLHDHAGVLEAAALGTPHDILGEVPIAFVSARGHAPLREEELRAFCATRLPAHKVPVRFVLVSELPKIAGIGKIDRRALREQSGAAKTGDR
jgi:long-chain acyl-CoA synthetase